MSCGREFPTGSRNSSRNLMRREALRPMGDDVHVVRRRRLLVDESGEPLSRQV